MSSEKQTPPEQNTKTPEPKLGKFARARRALKYILYKTFLEEEPTAAEVLAKRKREARANVQRAPVEKRTIENPDDLTLRDTAIMIGSIEKPFTLEELEQRFAEGHIMTPKASQILRSQVYALGAIHAIQAEPIRDADGNFTSRWNRTDKGDQVLKDVTGIPNSSSQITPRTAN